MIIPIEEIGILKFNMHSIFNGKNVLFQFRIWKIFRDMIQIFVQIKFQEHPKQKEYKML